MRFLHIAQQFRHRIQIPSSKLDVSKTVTKTLNKGGWVTPAYGFRKVLPEYLVLIDSAIYGDHQAKFAKTMMDQLAQNEVFIDTYYFDEDPRTCFSTTNKRE